MSWDSEIKGCSSCGHIVALEFSPNGILIWACQSPADFPQRRALAEGLQCWCSLAEFVYRRGLSFDWEGGLSAVGDSSVELQHKASDWRVIKE